MNTISKMLRDTKYLKTAADALKLGESKAEVSFVGRSNVGKSTLINAICQKKKMAHVSQVPGKTRTINVYEVTRGRWIVDLPGYGYAVGPRHEKERLGPMIEGYLSSREKLCMIFVIVDAVADGFGDVLIICYMAVVTACFLVSAGRQHAECARSGGLAVGLAWCRELVGLAVAIVVLAIAGGLGDFISG